MMGCCFLALGCVLAADPPLVTVDRDNIQITESCRLEIADEPIADADGNGVIQIIGDDITVEFPADPLRGAAEGTAPDEYTGVGVRITGRSITIVGASIHGYKAGIHAAHSPGLTIENCNLSDNFRQRLKSTVKAEDSSDWLWPHTNDERQWLDNYGAAMYIEDSDDVTVRNVTIRNGQNGILLDRVNDSRIYDNDCSFLSGWGLALWRCNRNVISRNAFDFCIRGYSHGIYNRGQDSAGILMFEQCSENVIAENSATHCGDGVFGFAGKEALGEVNPREDQKWYERRGNNDNLLIGNDFSFAAAHGIEMTFSFGNRIFSNKMIGNAICGIWGGYSQDTHIAGNSFGSNGEAGYGAERGGVNIEHGRGNRIESNRFRTNACGVRLWWDNDEGLLKSVWGKTNEKGSADNIIAGNRFFGDVTAIELRQTTGTRLAGNDHRDVDTFVDADDMSSITEDGALPPEFAKPEYPIFGEKKPVGARRQLRGRKNIVMTEWGPYDWAEPILSLVERKAGTHIYRVLGSDSPVQYSDIDVDSTVRPILNDAGLTLQPHENETLVPYELTVRAGEQTLRSTGVLARIGWQLTVFPYETDPREDADAWNEESVSRGVAFFQTELDFDYGMQGPSQYFKNNGVIRSQMPTDQFGMIGSSTVMVPEGKWRIRTISDDGIRLWLDDELVIDDWTHHAPRVHTYDLTVEEPRNIELRINHFELDGYAILSLQFEQWK